MKNLLRLIVVFAICAFINLNKLNAQTAYITENGKKFHAKNCSLVPKGKKGIDMKDANTKGYKPCAHCKADELKPLATKPKETTPKQKPKN